MQEKYHKYQKYHKIRAKIHLRNLFKKTLTLILQKSMTIDQINEFINKGGAALGLMLIAAILIFAVFRKDIEKFSRRK